MARKSSKQQLEQELQELRKQLEQSEVAKAALLSRAGTAFPGFHAASSSDRWVGIRSVTDNTITLKSPFPHEPDIQLFGSATPGRPGSQSMISLAWWLQLRTSYFVEQGYVIRDDSVLGGNYSVAPPDAPNDVPALASVNAILDPHEWITSRTEKEITTDLRKITSRDSLRRLRRAVDQELTRLQNELVGDPSAAPKSYAKLSAKYRLVDEQTTLLLERPDAAL